MSTLDFTIKVSNLAHYSILKSKDAILKAFANIAIEEGGDDDFAEFDHNKVAIALVMALPPIAYASLEGKPLSDDAYLALYLEAKAKLLNL